MWTWMWFQQLKKFILAHKDFTGVMNFSLDWSCTFSCSELEKLAEVSVWFGFYLDGGYLIDHCKSHQNCCQDSFVQDQDFEAQDPDQYQDSGVPRQDRERDFQNWVTRHLEIKTQVSRTTSMTCTPSFCSSVLLRCCHIDFLANDFIFYASSFVNNTNIFFQALVVNIVMWSKVS